jgi:hypothetical protein
MRRRGPVRGGAPKGLCGAFGRSAPSGSRVACLPKYEVEKTAILEI